MNEPAGESPLSLPLVLRPPLRRRLRLLLLSMVMTAGGVFLLVGGPDPIAKAVGGVGLAFFGSGLVLVLPRIVRPGALTVAADGVTDTTSLFTVGFIPWTAVTRIYVRRIAPQSRQKMVAFDLADLDAVARGRPWLRRGLALNRRFGADLAIAPIGVGLKPAELAALLRRVWSSTLPPAAPDEVQ